MLVGDSVVVNGSMVDGTKVETLIVEDGLPVGIVGSIVGFKVVVSSLVGSIVGDALTVGTLVGDEVIVGELVLVGVV